MSHLELTPEANLTDIKKAFRRMAKLYHPDLNHSENATKTFIRIREAYDFLLNYYNDQYLHEEDPIVNYDSKQQKDFLDEWIRYQKQKVRKQAAYEAKMKYENFKKTKAYKTANTFNKVADFVIFCSGIMIILGSVYGLHEKGIYDYSSGHKALDFNGILATTLVSIVGIVIVVFTYINSRISK